MPTVLLWQQQPATRPTRLLRASAILCTAAFIVCGAQLLFDTRVAHSAAAESSPQTSWVACSNSFAPLSDAAASALVTHQAENRPSNAPYNSYVPADSELSAFQGAKNQYNQTPIQGNPYDGFVDGRDGLGNPSTDDLIQWAAHKWGIPEDWLRAEYALESRWNQWGLGDRVTESASDYAANPSPARIYGTSDVYRSLGITQEGWFPDHTLGAGTEPLRWESTAFNIDYQTAQVRFYYDDPGNVRDTWGDGSYVKCQQWNSIGGWFNPYPWNNSGQQNYVSTVQSYLSQSYWATASFNVTAPPTVPAGLTATAQTTSSIHLSWQMSSVGAGMWGSASYEIFRNGSSQAMFAPLSATSMDDNSVSSGNDYTYQVAAVDDNGNLSGKTSVNVSIGTSNPPPTPPTAPPATPPPPLPPATPTPASASTATPNPTGSATPAPAKQVPTTPPANKTALTALPTTGPTSPSGPKPGANFTWLALTVAALLGGIGFVLIRKPF